MGCKHCGAVNPPGGMASRGLCWKCYRVPGIKAQYPVSKVTKPPGSKLWNRTFQDDPPGPDDPTPSEVEEFLAWWDREQQKFELLPELPRVCRVERG